MHHLSDIPIAPSLCIECEQNVERGIGIPRAQPCRSSWREEKGKAEGLDHTVTAKAQHPNPSILLQPSLQFKHGHSVYLP